MMSSEIDAYFDRLKGGAFGSSDPNVVPQEMLDIAGGNAQPRYWIDLASAVSSGYFGGGTDGDVTIAGTATLTRTMYYQNLTVPAGATLKTDGWVIYVENLLTVDGVISNNGTNAVGSTPGTSAPGVAGSGRYPATPDSLSGALGAAGGEPVPIAGDSSVATRPAVAVLVTGAAGGAGGAGGGGASGGGAPGGLSSYTGTSTAQDRSTTSLKTSTGGWVPGQPAPGGGGGGGGGGDLGGPGYPGGVGGTGGGAGGSGGVVAIFARTIRGSGSIQALGGNGANGTEGGRGSPGGSTGGGGGGGGGAGGSGGLVLLYSLDDSFLGTLSAAGGSGGLGGAGGAAGGNPGGNPGNSGANGSAGENGLIVRATA